MFASISHSKKIKTMGRNNPENIKKHNDKLHKAQEKVKKSAQVRKEQLKAIMTQYKESQTSQNN